jgi:hypothetical protein
VDKMSVQPQKVAFTTSEGTKQVFMATTVMWVAAAAGEGSCEEAAVAAGSGGTGRVDKKVKHIKGCGSRQET